MIVFVAEVSRAQTCPLSSCHDSLPNTATTDPLILVSPWVVQSWTVQAGCPGTVNAANNSISGLVPGTTTVLLLQAVNGNTVAVSVKRIVVAPLPVPPPAPVVISITGVTFVAGRLNISLSNGQTLAL